MASGVAVVVSGSPNIVLHETAVTRALPRSESHRRIGGKRLYENIANGIDPIFVKVCDL